MMPFLSPLSNGKISGVLDPSRGESPLPPPPRGFTPIRGTPLDVAFSTWRPPKSRGNTSAQKAGLRYEARVCEAMAKEFGPSFVPQPTISFTDAGGSRAAIPDGLLRVGDAVGIVEIKYTHTPLAWWQLRKLYEPLLQRLTTNKIILFEVCHSYDPAVDFPEPYGFIHSLRSPPTLYPVQVLQWRP